MGTGNGGGRQISSILAGIAITGLAMLVAGRLAGRSLESAVDYEAALIGAAGPLTGYDDLAGRFQAHQRNYLPIALPDPEALWPPP